MKKTLLTAMVGAGSLGVLGVLGLVGFTTVRWDADRGVAEPALSASTDSAIIERGRYLAYGPAHCAYCHSPMETWAALDAGERPPLVGGGVFHTDFGTFVSPNITPDPETGIGSVSDGKLARMLRHNVRSSGRVAVPFMEFQNLSDEDVVALLSFMRAQEPVRNATPEPDINALGRAIMTFLIKPVNGEPPRTAPAEEPTLERGEYVAINVANCVGCHTQRSLTDGSYTGPRFAGGFRMALDDDPSRALITPNLTPDPTTGRITGWSEDRFVARFRAGRQFEESHMPWNAYARMSDTDLRAVYRYLRSLPPVVNETPVGIVVTED